jgi:hypothetical protein
VRWQRGRGRSAAQEREARGRQARCDSAALHCHSLVYCIRLLVLFLKFPRAVCFKSSWSARWRTMQAQAQEQGKTV